VKRAGLALLLAASLSCGGQSSESGGGQSSKSGGGGSRALVAHASWSHTAAGYRLQVRPTVKGRLTAATHAATALSESLAEAGSIPQALTAAQRESLEDQLRCHAVFAPHKPVWNLETWRPDVGYPRTVLNLCNP
jgi:hypothetical protein